DNLLRGIYSYGFEVPSKIQQLAIVPIKEKMDILAQAQSGTGKTGAFTIGSMSIMDPTLQKPQVMVLVPTQELAKQIFNVAKQLGIH
ncbi:DEAD/DEAH box helicase, partial [Streptococcus pneumoniae]|uniref:DEAD/DEAH box helicase n=1 Tax=Streptococcus pneumoniae TaxID=1313 RepID=UPI0012D80B66